MVTPPEILGSARGSPGLFFLFPSFLLAPHSSTEQPPMAAGGCDNGAAVDPLAGERAPQRVSASPSSGLAVASRARARLLEIEWRTTCTRDGGRSSCVPANRQRDLSSRTASTTAGGEDRVGLFSFLLCPFPSGLGFRFGEKRNQFVLSRSDADRSIFFQFAFPLLGFDLLLLISIPDPIHTDRKSVV